MRLNWRAVCLITVAITGLVPMGAVNRPGFVGGYDALASGMIIV